MSEVLPLHEWSSLTLTLDDRCEPHVDRGNRNRPGRSLLIGVSNHDSGGIGIACPDGNHFIILLKWAMPSMPETSSKLVPKASLLMLRARSTPPAGGREVAEF